MKYIPYGQHWLDNDDIKAVIDVLKGDWLTQGMQVDEFEQAVGEYCHAPYAVAFSSGTAGLHAAAYAAGITKGKEAITTPITFAADGNCVLYMGGTVRFADIRKDTYNIDPQEIRKHITSKTKALIPVDFAGQPCDIDEINQIAHEHNLVVIEDACHGIGSEYKGKKLGSFSDMTVFQLHPVKTITTGEGGMVLTNSEQYYEQLRLFRTHGITKDPKKMHSSEGGWFYEMQELGYNYRITDFQCALGKSQLKKLDAFIQRRRDIVHQYNEAFHDLDEIIIPFEKPDVKSAYHLYVIQLKTMDRKTAYNELRARNIGAQVHYIPVHLHPYYQEHFGFKAGDFPNAEEYYQHALSLPLFPKMTDTDVNDVIHTVTKVVSTYQT